MKPRASLLARADRTALVLLILTAGLLAGLTVLSWQETTPMPAAAPVRLQMQVAVTQPAPAVPEPVPEPPAPPEPEPPVLTAPSAEPPLPVPPEPEIRPAVKPKPVRKPEVRKKPEKKEPVTKPVPAETPAADPAPAAAPVAAPLPVATAPAPTAPTAGWLTALAAEISRLKRYPNAARRAGHEGTGILTVTVDSQGKILAAELETSAGKRSLDGALRQLAGKLTGRTLTASPASVQTVRVPVKFVLTEG